MSITRADVADLRAGDVVRITGWFGLTVEGPLQDTGGSLWLGQHIPVRIYRGSLPVWASSDSTLTVISRAKPPLYVNSDKTEPDPGDVVRAADSDDPRSWVTDTDGLYCWLNTKAGWVSRSNLPTRLRLLVDGRTGQVAPETHGSDGQR